MVANSNKVRGEQAQPEREDWTIYPFNTPEFDPAIVNGGRIQEILRDGLAYAAQSIITYCELRNGQGYLYPGITYDRAKSLFGQKESEDHGAIELRIFLISHDVSHDVPISMAKEDLIDLFERASVPAEFVEVLYDQNGLIYAFPDSARSTRSSPPCHHVYWKAPRNLYLNHAVYFSHDSSKNTSTLLYFGSDINLIGYRLSSLFGRQASSEIAKRTLVASPFVVLSAVAAEHSVFYEQSHLSIQKNARRYQHKIGLKVKLEEESALGQTEELGQLTKQLLRNSDSLSLLRWITNFEVESVEFLMQQHDVVEKSMMLNSNQSRIRQAEKVRRSLELSLTRARMRLKSIEALAETIHMHLSEIRSMMAQNDSITRISIADESKRIVHSARKDSSAMKAISMMTMTFLPTTVVATIFGMDSFFSGGPDGLTVNNGYWIFILSSTLLTVVVLMTYYWDSFVRDVASLLRTRLACIRGKKHYGTDDPKEIRGET